MSAQKQKKKQREMHKWQSNAGDNGKGKHDWKDGVFSFPIVVEVIFRVVVRGTTFNFNTDDPTFFHH